MKLFKTNFDVPPGSSSQTPGSKKTAFSFITGVFIIALIAAMTSCTKESETKSNFDYNNLYNRKWLTLSQETTPTWTYPATGKSYTDLFQFAKEVFPCVVDDYLTHYRDGSTHIYYSEQKCDPNDPAKEAPVGYHFLDKPNDSIFLTLPLEVPGQKPEILNVRCKILELTNDKMVTRYFQTVPFTFTKQLITETFKAIP